MGRIVEDEPRASVAIGGMTLIWSRESIHDLISLRAHIAEHDPGAAKRVALHVLYCVEHNPQLGAPPALSLISRPEFPPPCIRCWLCSQPRLQG
jgi:hypothetical protein